jgi:hypothetical protein
VGNWCVDEKQSLDAVRVAIGFDHPTFGERRVFWVERRVVREKAKERDHGGEFGNVALVQLLIAMQCELAVLLMDGAQARPIEAQL